MNSPYNCPPKIAQNRHILALAGIPLWTKKHPIEQDGADVDIVSLPPTYDRLQSNPRLNHLLPNKSPASSPPASSPKLSKLSKPSTKQHTKLGVSSSVAQNVKLPSKPQASSVVEISKQAPQATTKPQRQAETSKSALPAHLDVRFALQGVRFGQWVLIVDVLMMNRDEQSLWQSLKNALSNQANHQPITAFYREITYPLIKNEFRSDVGLNPAQYTFDGFVIGLCVSVGQHQAVQVAFLTDMPTAIITQTTQSLPNIHQMMMNPTLKKQFWQTVVG